MSKTTDLADRAHKLADDVWELARDLEPGRKISASDNVRELKDISTAIHYQASRLLSWR